jgi:hypothetical protein
LDFKSQTRTIEGFEITVQVLPATRSLPLLPRITRVVAAATAMGFDLDSDISKALLHVDGAELLSLAAELLASAQVKHEGRLRTLDRATMDLVFTGRIKALLAASWFAVQVNYADFFADASATGPAAEASPA